jgi:hypothetical protein
LYLQKPPLAWPSGFVFAPAFKQNAEGTPDQQFVKSRRRADLVRKYLEAHFHLLHSDVGIMPLGHKPPPGAGRNTWNGVGIVLFEDRQK